MNKRDLQNKVVEVWDVLFSHLFQYVKEHNNKVELDDYFYGLGPTFGSSINTYDYMYLYINDKNELVLHYKMIDIKGEITEHEASHHMFTLDDLSLIINKIKE